MNQRYIISLAFFSMFLFVQSAVSATYVVTKTADTNDGNCNADCSLREAVTTATSTAEDDVIEFETSLFSTPRTITLSGSEISITSNGTLNIIGPGANLLTINGNNASRILFNDTGAVTSISGIRFRHGNGAGTVNTGRGGAIYNRGGNLTVRDSIIYQNTAANGGGVNAATSATTTYENCEIWANTSTGAGGGMQNFSGSILFITNSAIVGNTSGSTITGGGGIQGNGTITITNSTFSDNEAVDSGGGIYYNGQGLVMTNSTLANNRSANDGGGIHKATSTLNAFLRNNLIADNAGSAASTDITGTFNSNGNNLVGVVGTSTGWVAADITNQPALISPLGYYGGIGQTHIPLTNSPALDAGDNCVTDLSCGSENPPIALTSDQRGAGRPSNAIVDIGSAESNSSYRAILKNAAVTIPYNQFITLDSGSFSYIVFNGGLPPNMALVEFLSKSAQGSGLYAIIGAPTATGVYDFSVTIDDGMNSSVVNYQITVEPQPAPVPISGRVFNSAGNSIPRAYLTISDGNGLVSAVRANQFGNFSFNSIEPGRTYTIAAFAKEHQFSPVQVNPLGYISDLMITADPPPPLVEKKK